MIVAIPQAGHACGPPAIYAPGGRVVADFTGDGAEDRATIVHSRCGWFLSVESRGRRYRLSLGNGGAAGPLWPFGGVPALRRAANLDHRSGEELLVAVGTGASSTAYRVVTFVDGALRPMRVVPTQAELYANTFVTVSTTSFAAAFGCVRRGVIAEDGWSWRTGVGERRSFAVDGLTWRLVQTATFRLDAHGRPPAEVRYPFANCR